MPPDFKPIPRKKRPASWNLCRVPLAGPAALTALVQRAVRACLHYIVSRTQSVSSPNYFLAAFFAGFAAAALGLQPVLHPDFAAGFASVFFVAAFFVAISYGSFCRASML